jgi:hypothetical protein
MRRRIAVALAVCAVFLSLPSISASSPVYGPSVGSAKKACLANGGTWTPYFQTCSL